jgi:hypothetical protein
MQDFRKEDLGLLCDTAPLRENGLDGWRFEAVSISLHLWSYCNFLRSISRAEALGSLSKASNALIPSSIGLVKNN